MTSEIIKTEEVLGQTMNVYGTIENPLFLAKDVAEWIGHVNPSQMLAAIDDDEKLVSSIMISGQKREVLMITEDGLYEVLMLSRKPIAKEFKKGVKVVLKKLRTQGYVKAENITRSQLANMVLEAEKELEIKNAQLVVANERIEKDAPRVNYVQEFFEANGTMSVGEMAKTFGIKPNTMFRTLRDDGYLIKRKGTEWNNPKQQYMDAGYFKLKVTVRNGVEYTQARVTPRGHAYFAKKYNLFSMTVVNPI